MTQGIVFDIMLKDARLGYFRNRSYPYNHTRVKAFLQVIFYGDDYEESSRGITNQVLQHNNNPKYVSHPHYVMETGGLNRYVKH